MKTETGLLNSAENEGVECIWMRGGTSKGAFFRAEEFPSDPAQRDELLLRIFGSPDPRQIDGIGGGDPLTSKAALLSPPIHPDADVEYLFLQVFPDRALVSDAQGCGNILAGVGPAAIEMGLVAAQDGETEIRIHMCNTGEIARAVVQTPGGRVCYSGEAQIDGVPGQHAPIPLMFENLAGSQCGALLPTGREWDKINGTACTLIDNGMPCVIMKAAEFGLSGQESPEQLEANSELKTRLESIRLSAGALMGLGDVTDKSVPKMILVSTPVTPSGVVHTRAFIPHRCHASIGVFAAVSVATACCLPTGPGSEVARLPNGALFAIEHPIGAAEVVLNRTPDGAVIGAGTLRTARKLMAGRVFPAPRR